MSTWFMWFHGNVTLSETDGYLEGDLFDAVVRRDYELLNREPALYTNDE